MPSVAEKMRAKMEAFTDRLQGKTAKVRSKFHTTYLATKTPDGDVRFMKSSWIRSFAYDKYTQTLYMTVKTGKTYKWTNIDRDTAAACMGGDAWCRTNDPTGKRRWWKDKHPSQGAAFWTYLKNAGVVGTTVDAIPDDTMGGYDIYAGDFQFTTASKTTATGSPYYPKKVGAKTKAQRTQERFGKLGKYHKPKVAR